MRILPALFLLCACLLGQRTWIVHCTAGPGVDFTDLPPAVAAASPGDTILLTGDVSSCPAFAGFAGAVIDKPLSIIGVSQWDGVDIRGLIEIRGIQAGERVLLADFSIQPPLNISGPHGLYVHDCAGSVHLQWLYYRPNGFTGGRAHFVDCANLTMNWCELGAPGSSLPWFSTPAPSPLPEDSILFRRTNAVLRECPMGSEPAIFSGSPFGTQQPARGALWLENSNVTICDSYVVGADERRDPFMHSRLYWPQGYAIVQDGGSLTIGAATALYGGYYDNFVTGLVEGDAVLSTNNGTIVEDPVTVNTGCVCPLHQTRIVPTVFMERVYRNRTFRASVRGEPNDFALLGIGGYAPPGTSLPLVLGQLLIAPQGLTIVAAAQLSQYGSIPFTFYMHPAVPMDAVFAFQAGLLHANGSIELTVPAPFSVLWELGRPWP